MSQNITLLAVLLMIAVSLTGCTGTDRQPEIVAHFTGQNQVSTSQFSLDPGPAQFTMYHGSRIDSVEDAFIVKLMDQDGDLVERILVTTGPYDGIITVKVPNDGYYFLNVIAAAPWEITVSQ